jgi:uncharacterized protein (DUF1330 family)
MNRLKHFRLVIAFAALAAVFSAGTLLAAGKPKTVIHVVTVKWKEGTTPEQIRAALEGVEKMGEKFPGIKNVWLRTIKAQGAMTHAIVMEFESEQALKEYAGSAAQKEWYKVYIPIREQSITFDVTN